MAFHMRVLSGITDYSVRAGTTSIDNLAFRKCKKLSSVSLPEGLLSIGDCAFSFCYSLRQIQVPASVKHIGVAAFLKSGIVTIQFLGIPKVIEADVFEGCGQLKEIVVPNGSRDVFIRKFGLPEDKIVEGKSHIQVTKQRNEIPQEPTKVNLLNQRRVQLLRFSYNATYFYWAVGDEVDLRKVFSGPIVLAGNVTYEFRKKALFIFIKSVIAKTLDPYAEYELPTDIVNFTYRYRDKYVNRLPRIFIFVCDDGRTAKVFDEVKIVSINKNTIMVKTLLEV